MGRRIGILALVVVTVSMLAGAAIATAVANLTGIPRWVALLLPPALLVIAVRRVRRRSGSGWTPLRSLIDATTALADGDESVRVPVPPGGPMRDLARSFNRMAERLESETARRRRLLADVSHEVRTPLTVIRGEIEAIRDGIRDADVRSYDSLLEEVAVLDRLLDDLRTLSLAEAGQLRIEREPVDLRHLVEDGVTALAATASSRQVRLTVDGDDHLPCELDPVRFREVVANLVLNAIRHSPSGGTVLVTVRARGPDAVLEVQDEGPGIEPGRADDLFERFVRAADSGGSGLGLPIVRDLVEAHGGTVVAGNRDGGGAMFTVTVPVG